MYSSRIAGTMSVFRLLLVVVLFSDVFATSYDPWCPHEDPSLTSWSHLYNDGSVDEFSNITITDRVLLDMSVDVFSITITPTGALVWSPHAEPCLTVGYILVHGSLIIGSEDCPYTDYARIAFKGSENSYDVPDFAEKFLGVAAGGTLEIYGEERIGWTKLTSTVERCEKGDCILFEQNKDLTSSQLTKTAPSLIISVYNVTTGQPIKYTSLSLAAQRQNTINNRVANFRQFLDGVDDGCVVAMAILKYGPGPAGTVYMETAGFFDYLEEVVYGVITDSMAIRHIERYDAYTLVFIKGDNETAAEHLEKVDGRTGPIKATSVLRNQIYAKVTSQVSVGSLRQSFVDVVTARIDKATPRIDVVDDVSPWRPGAIIKDAIYGAGDTHLSGTPELTFGFCEGDLVLIASTDYDWEQAEVAELINCDECSDTQIRVELLAKYEHYGEVYKNVDMSAEVALLTRNILFDEAYGGGPVGFGGHVKIVKDFESVHIVGAEFYGMGQAHSIGRYPVHFHGCEDVGAMDNPPYVRYNSVHHSYARCITVHATSGLVIEDNVCFDSIGHGYFLEDGSEKETVFDGNLGLGQRKGSLVFTDGYPATFFITNPQTYLRNNAAAGGLRAGYWFAYPDEPMGMSVNLTVPAMQPGEARHTAIYEFTNNVAHSYQASGLLIDYALRPDGRLVANNRYEPWNTPLDPRSGPKEVLLTRYTGYKNRRHNAYISGGYVTLEESSFSDSAQSVIFERSSRQWQSVRTSVFLGDSPNTGLHDHGYNRSRPLGYTDPVQGFVFNDGPVNLQQSWFSDFDPSQQYKSMALGFNPNDGGAISQRSFVQETLFGFDDPTSYRVFDGNSSTDGFSDTDTDLVSAFIDRDGSLTTQAGNTVLKPLPFHLTESCIVNEHWGLAVCPQHYAQLLLSYKGSAATMSRDDDPTLSYTDNPSNLGRFLVIKGFETSYILNFDGSVPSSFSITGSGIDNFGGVRIGVCVPRDAILKLRTNKPRRATRIRRWVPVSSVQEVDDDTIGARYYFDSTVGIVFFKLFHSWSLVDMDPSDCPRGVCPFVTVGVRGTLSDSDCTGRAYAVYNRTVVFPPIWGAGVTRLGQGESFIDVLG